MRSYIRFSVGLVIVVISMMFLLACEDRPKEADLKASLGKLAEEYWNKRLIDRDYKSTYSMEAVRGSLPFTEYQKKVFNAGQIAYISIKTQDTKIEKDNGFVDLTMRCRVTSVPKELDLSYKKDRWVLKSGKWEHVLKEK